MPDDPAGRPLPGGWGLPGVGEDEGRGAARAGMGLLPRGGEGHEVTGVCGRALCFAGGTLPGAWMTGRRPGVIHALRPEGTQARPPTHGCRLEKILEYLYYHVNDFGVWFLRGTNGPIGGK